MKAAAVFFRRKKPSQENDAEPINGIARKPQANSSSAETAHLIGPGCLKLQGGLLRWQPVEGRHIILHPHQIARILMYGATDVTGSALRLIWQSDIQVVFLSPQGHQLLGKVQPAGNSPNLIWLQHQTIMDSQFRLSISKQLIVDKIEAAISQARYFQRQGKASAAGGAIQQLKKLQDSCSRSKSLDSLRGIEGTAASTWFQLFASLMPNGWTFPGRRSRPATDPVNGLLSLGYTFLVARCQTLLAASDLDPLVGFLHDVRPGRPSLACDLMEPFRISLVDRLVLNVLSTRRLSLESFEQTPEGIRLLSPDFKIFLTAFEEEFHRNSPNNVQREIQARIDQWIQEIRSHCDSFKK